VIASRASRDFCKPSGAGQAGFYCSLQSHCLTALRKKFYAAGKQAVLECFEKRGIDFPMPTVAEHYRYLTRTPGVRGGVARIEGTRIGVHDVIGLLQNGETVDTITVTCLPDLTKAQVYECLAYYEDHRGEIDLLVARQMSPPDAHDLSA
jgi:uncharacterized protein (DUF433 family)